MRKRHIGSTVFCLILVLILAAALPAAWYITEHYVLAGGGLYPRGEKTLDLRGEKLSVQDYETICWELPDTLIHWSVPFQGGYLPDTTKEISVSTLTAEDIRMLGYFPQLETVNAEACSDYALLREAVLLYPQADIRYHVEVGGERVSSQDRSITLVSLTPEEEARLACLPNLRTIDATHCRDYDTIQRVIADHPEWEVAYTHNICGVELDPAARELEVTGAAYGELYAGMGMMKNLKNLMIHDPQMDAAELGMLQTEYPGVDIRWDVKIFGKVWPSDTQELDISYQPISSIEEAREYASHFPQLTKLIVEKGSISSAEMAEFREEMRSQYKVVWTIVFSDKCKARTDDTYFMPTKQHEYYFLESYVDELVYLEDVLAVDLGHHAIKTTDWLKGMPKLKYLVLTYTNVQYITNIEYCKDLIFLEVDWNFVRSLGNIQECTKLEDLSICWSQVDPSTLLSLKSLKHLRWQGMRYSDAVALTEAVPGVEIALSTSAGFNWRQLQNYYDQRDTLGMPYMR